MRREPSGAGRRGPPIGVLVVDDHSVFRDAAREVVDATPDFELLGEAASGEEALVAAAELVPDLVVLDVRMQGMDGIATARLIHDSHPGSVVVLVTIDDASEVPRGVSTCGAAELVRKRDFGPALLRRVWAAHGPHGP